jgi:hypothetical protein
VIWRDTYDRPLKACAFGLSVRYRYDFKRDTARLSAHVGYRRLLGGFDRITDVVDPMIHTRLMFQRARRSPRV